ncbi:unnamed protein product [Mortierella alpina]
MNSEGLSTGAIVGIVFGSALGFTGLIYLCCYRKQVAARQTQKLMDATNLIHAQPPQGTLSQQVLPDGTVGVFIRPMPIATPLMGQPLPQPQYQVQRPHPPPPPIEPDMFQQLPYNPGLAAAPSSLALSSTFAQPSAPIPPEAQQQLQFSSHPRPNVVTTIGDEVKEGVVEEAKGDPEGDAWDDAPFVAPTGYSAAPMLTPSPLATGSPYSPSSISSIRSAARPATPADSIGIAPSSEPDLQGPQAPAHENPHHLDLPSIPSTRSANASSIKTPPDVRNPHGVQADVVISMPSLDVGRVYPMDQDLLPPRPAHNPHALSVTLDRPEEGHNF